MTPFDWLTSAIDTFAAPPDFVDDVEVLALHKSGQGVAADGVHVIAATVGARLLHQLRTRQLAGYHVGGEYLGEVALHLRLEQRVDGAGGQCIERRVHRCENSERPGTLQGLDQPGGLDGGDEGRVILGVDGVFDDVLVGIHRSASDHRIVAFGSHGLCGHWRRRHGITGRRRQQHLVDDVDDAVRLLDVGDGDVGDPARFVGQRNFAAVHLGLKDAATDGLDRVGAAIVRNHLADGVRHGVGSDHMTGQNLDQLILVLWFEQRVDGAGGQCVEGRVDRCENREGASALQGLDQPGGLDGGDQGRVILGVDGVLDDVLVGVHRRASDHRIILS